MICMIWIIMAVTLLGWIVLQFERVQWFVIRIMMKVYRKLGWVGIGKYTDFEHWMMNHCEGYMTSVEIGKLIGRSPGSIRQEKYKLKKQKGDDE